MTSHTMSPGPATHQTIAVASTAETVTMDVHYDAVEVINWDATNKLYFTVNALVPTVAGDGTYVVGPGDALVVAEEETNIAAVQLISAGTVAYTVTGLKL